MKIFVVRHGVTPLNVLGKVNGEIDEPLTPEGLAAAQDLAKILPNTVTEIFSSPLLRAQQTAKAFGVLRNLPIHVAPSLTEVKMGKLAGQSWSEMVNGEALKKAHRSLNFDYRSFGGESFAQVRKRLLAFIRRVNSLAAADFSFLFVTHGGIIRVLNYLHSGMIIDDTQKHLEFLEFDLSQMLEP
jgi:broad specificity phosphatase PhoE